MSLINKVVVLIIELARTFITLEYFKIFLYSKGKVDAIIRCVIAFLITTVCFLEVDNNYINTISTILSINTISIAYDGKVKRKLLLSILCYSIMVAVDFIVYIISTDKNDNWEYQMFISFISVLFFYLYSDFFSP